MQLRQQLAGTVEGHPTPHITSYTILTPSRALRLQPLEGKAALRRGLEAMPGGFQTEEYRLLNALLEAAFTVFRGGLHPNPNPNPNPNPSPNQAAFTVRTYPAPECFKRAAALMNAEIYVGMQGASEFTIGGVLASWSVTAQLHRVRTPTLLTHGRFDTMRPPVLRAMAAALPHAKVVLMPRSGHCSMIDDPALMNDEIAAFLDCVESGASASACTTGGEMPALLSAERGRGPAATATSSSQLVVSLSLSALVVMLVGVAALFRQRWRRRESLF